MTPTAGRRDLGPLTWLRDDWGRLNLARRSGRLMHGLLISGPRGVGKRVLADRLARSLLCAAPDEHGIACGHCVDCGLLAVDNHPDLVRVGPDPDAKSSEIRVGQIRSLAEREALTPSRGDWKVALIDPADQLNTAAANGLLKTLEEPPGASLMVLVTEWPGRLPATIRSRCGHIRVRIPDRAEALAWLVERVGDRAEAAPRLALARGAPLRALEEIDGAMLAHHAERLAGFLAIARGDRDPLIEAAAWVRLGPGLALEWIGGWLADLTRLMVASDSSRDPPETEMPRQQGTLRAIAPVLNPVATHRLLQRVLEARALVGTSLNPDLLMESVSIEWLRVATGRAFRRI